MNGDLRVAYRASREGPRDIVFVPNWFTYCEHLPELPSIQGWVEAMTSLGRLIFFDQPGTGASDPVTPGALPTLEQWADSITAVLDDLGSREAVLLAIAGALATAALFAATHPSRTTALVVLEGYADPADAMMARSRGIHRCPGRHVGNRGVPTHVINPDMPWNEEIRAAWARHGTPGGQPAHRRSRDAAHDRNGRAGAASDSPRADPRRPAHRRPIRSCPRWARYIADHIPGAKYVELPGRNVYHFVEPWRESFQEVAEFLTGQQADVADDRVLATVLFTDIVDSTRRAAEMGDRDWHALLDAHDAVVRSQLDTISRPRGEHVRGQLPGDV